MTELQIGDLVRNLKKLERSVAAKGEDIVRLRFEQGCLLKDIVGNTNHGDSQVENISKETRIPESTLRIAYGHAKRFNFKETLLEKEITKLKEAGKSISYGYFRAALKEDQNPDLHGGEEKHKEHLLKKYETAGSALGSARDHYPQDREVKGAQESFEQVTEDAKFVILGNEGRGTSGVKKSEREECELYLHFIREQPDIISGEMGCQAHHPVYKSEGNNASDFYALPLTARHHEEAHKLGRKKFTEKYGLDLDKIIWGLVIKFIRELLK